MLRDDHVAHIVRDARSHSQEAPAPAGGEDGPHEDAP